MRRLRLGRPRSGWPRPRSTAHGSCIRAVRARQALMPDRPHHQRQRCQLYGKHRALALPHTSRRGIRCGAGRIGGPAVRDAFIRTLTELVPQHPEVVLLSGDLGFAVLNEYIDRFPRQFLNVGIAEQNMSGLAAGLALEGHAVFTYSIGSFPTLRCLEQIRNDICYHGANVKIVCVGGGMSYEIGGFLPPSNQKPRPLRPPPNMLVLSPGDLWEAAEAARYLVSHRGPAYLRLDKSAAPAT